MDPEKIDYLENSLSTYLDRLAGNDPVPGGGSAAALSLGLGAALFSMSARFSLGRKKFAGFEAEARQILERSESIRRTASELVEADSRIYLDYRKAAARPREDPQRGPAMARAAGDGNQLLLSMIELAGALLELAEPLARKGNPYLISDVGCGVVLARGAWESARLNILINLAGQPDLPGGMELRRELETLTGRLDRQAQAILELVREKLE
ncbi:MAG TPA: cyclodeaminase/cyclohydrolase family protein [bacterium]|uniref:Methenyltetrahydrofolate cyclohydrolase n=1 Tax=candidate division TA06 bacterium ADurb.Bin417 TaxID=1852828 RepID=A0A1V5MK54_UNCT6|nr:MAG: Methenyltetrahydrofolate cyclohydrolase [candidate division TA06 bacterium ADurb.Bin417]HNQ35996.1 cyclodeaminase/cyclohydrolase family protein [bacterium]HNS48530.1 cyclodeaminase/cyclohydrolase family protein [bacterium]